MPRYSFTIVQGGQLRPSNSSADSAQTTAQAIKRPPGTFADMSRGISERLELDDSDWQIEVADEAGKSIFRIKVAAEFKVRPPQLAAALSSGEFPNPANMSARSGMGGRKFRCWPFRSRIKSS